MCEQAGSPFHTVNAAENVGSLERPEVDSAASPVDALTTPFWPGTV